MRRFEILTMQRVHVKNVNPRREKHGTENKPAVDIKLQIDMPNAALDMFDPALLASLYCKLDGGAPGETASLPGTEIAQLPNLRFPKLAPLRWDLECVGYTVTLDQGLGGKKSDIVLPECKLSKFEIEAKEGGTCVIKLRAQTNHVDASQFGRLCTLIDAEISATLIGPKPEEDGQDLAGEKGKADPKGPRADSAWPFPKGDRRGKGKAEGQEDTGGERTPEQALAESTGAQGGAR